MTTIRQFLEPRFGILRGKQSALPREESLALAPVRNPVVTWEQAPVPEDAEDAAETAGAVHISVPRRDDRFSRFVARILHIPDKKKIELDLFGAEIWTRCDGEHTIDDLIRILSNTYKLNRRQCEVSVITFIKMLSQRRLILFSTESRGAAPNVQRKSERTTSKPRKRGKQ